MSQKKVYGIGLPRTGTKTLAQSLRILGYCGSNTCVLTDNKKKDMNFSSSQKMFIVNNGMYNYYKTIYKFNKDAKFILSTRDFKTWKDSVTGFSKHKDLELPDIRDYEVEISKFFPKNSLLIIDIFKEPSDVLWKKICDFLFEKYPICHFPFPTCNCHTCKKPGCDLEKQRLRSNTI